MMKKAVKIFIVLSAIVGTATTVRAEGDKGLIGFPMPSMIKKAVDILKDTAESGAR